MGHWTYVVGLSVYAYEQGGTTAVGIISVLRLLPAALASPFLATLADRYRRERVMMATDLIRAVLMALAAVVIATDGPALVVYAVVILTNLVGVAFRPAQAALLPGLAREPCRAVGGERRREHPRRRLDLRRARRSAASSSRSGTSQAVFGAQRALVPLVGGPARSAFARRRRHASPLDASGNRPGFASELSEGLKAVASDRERLDGDGASTRRRRSSPGR